MARVLLIDDQETIRVLLRTALEGAGYEVFEAANGSEGLACYREHPADIVITDIVMPEMDGLELIAKLTQSFSNVKIIAMSGRHGEQDNLRAATLLGAQQALRKPFSMEQLLRAVRDGLGL